MKFYWNTATPIHLHIIYTAFKLQRPICKRPYDRKAQNISSLAFYRKFVNP